MVDIIAQDGSSVVDITDQASAAIGNLTQADLTALINVATTTTSGAISSLPTVSPTTKFLRGDGTFSELPAVAIPAPRGYLFGLTLSPNGTNTFGIASGEAADSTASVPTIMSISSAYTKTIAAWAVGTGQGSWDGTGSNPTSTASWYSVWVMRRLDTGVVDFCIKQGATVPSIASYSLYRRIGSVRTDGAGHFVRYSQLGDRFLMDVAIQDVGGFTGTTAIQTVTLTNCPLGLQTDALIYVLGYGGSGVDGRVWVFSPDINSAGSLSGGAPARMNAGGYGVAGVQSISEMYVRTNTASQIKYCLTAATGQIYISSAGWIDTRGRLY